MLLQMYENPIAGEDWQTKNVTENNKAWFKKKSPNVLFVGKEIFLSKH